MELQAQRAARGARLTLTRRKPIERLNADINRRTDVIGIFPKEVAVVRRVSALFLEQSDGRATLPSRRMTLDAIRTASDTTVVRPALDRRGWPCRSAWPAARPASPARGAGAQHGHGLRRGDLGVQVELTGDRLADRLQRIGDRLGPRRDGVDLGQGGPRRCGNPNGIAPRRQFQPGSAQAATGSNGRMRHGRVVRHRQERRRPAVIEISRHESTQSKYRLFMVDVCLRPLGASTQKKIECDFWLFLILASSIRD
jgi:hypothetical protein